MGLSTLYTKRFQAIVNESVTKGLDKAVSFKPSGQEWVPEIPAHWDTPRFKYVGTIKTHQTVPAQPFSDPFGDAVNPQTPYFYDLAITKGGLVATVAIKGIAIEGSASSFLYVKFKEDQYPAYWVYFLNGHFAQNWLRCQLPTEGSGRPGSMSRRSDLGIEVLGNLPTFRPPYEEQMAIATYLQTEQTKLTQIKDALS
jgi:restriction endonuclease S subunit